MVPFSVRFVSFTRARADYRLHNQFVYLLLLQLYSPLVVAGFHWCS